MVRLVIKKGDQAYFLLETFVTTTVDDFLDLCCEIYNGYLKIHRICGELEELAEHGVSLPPNMQGLTDEQILDLKLVDEWGKKCIPSGGFINCKDDIGRRNGQGMFVNNLLFDLAPNGSMANVLRRTAEEAKALISKDLVKRDLPMTKSVVKEAIMMLSGAVTIVYPMGLPPYDPIKLELDNEEDLSGTHASQEVIRFEEATIWFSGKELLRGHVLSDYIGNNEKTKIIVKLTKRGSGPPAREPIVSEEQQRSMMAYYYKKQEELKKLEADNEDSYLDSPWAESGQLKRHFHGLNNIKWGPR